MIEMSAAENLLVLENEICSHTLKLKYGGS
jgi:hypothetical protein